LDDEASLRLCGGLEACAFAAASKMGWTAPGRHQCATVGVVRTYR
jgi:hypothetical protein